MLNGTNDAGLSMLESPLLMPERPHEFVRKFECRVSLQEMHVVFLTRHYELLNYFISTLMRMKNNGRPDQQICSVRHSDPSAFHQKILEDTPKISKTHCQAAGNVVKSKRLACSLNKLPFVAASSNLSWEIPQCSSRQMNCVRNFAKLHIVATVL